MMSSTEVEAPTQEMSNMESPEATTEENSEQSTAEADQQVSFFNIYVSFSSLVSQFPPFNRLSHKQTQLIQLMVNQRKKAPQNQ